MKEEGPELDRDLVTCSMLDLRRAATHESGHVIGALHFALPLARVWIDDNGSGLTEYSRHLGTGEVEARTIATFSGIEAETDRFGDAPIEGDERAIEQMIERLGLHWTESSLNRFRQRARVLVQEEHRAITVLADALCDRKRMTGDEARALLSTITAPRMLWVA